MIRPNPRKLVCPKCGFSKVIIPKSDRLSPKDLMSFSDVCPKCKISLQTSSVGAFELVVEIFKKALSSKFNKI